MPVDPFESFRCTPCRITPGINTAGRVSLSRGICSSRQSMHFLLSTVAALAGFSAVAAAPNVVKRAGSITAPASGTSIASGGSIPFNYIDLNWCHEGYTPITIWLSDSAPTGLNATGELPEGTYIDYFGEYLIPNFGMSCVKLTSHEFVHSSFRYPLGLGPLPGSTVPPTSLTIPDISGYSAGSPLYLTVVETALAGTCPPVRFSVNSASSESLIRRISGQRRACAISICHGFPSCCIGVDAMQSPCNLIRARSQIRSKKS